MLSVIIPVYNIESFVERCVMSVINQSCKDFEIILVNDGSTDNSGKICDALAEKYSGIKVIHQKNLGLSAARNSGLKAAEGDLISFIDGDDCISPFMFEKTAECIATTDCDIVQCGFKEFDSIVPPVKTPNEIDYTEFSKEEALRLLIKNTDFKQVVWNKIYKKSVICDISFKNGKYHEDEFFTWRAFYNSEKIVNMNFCGYYYYKRADSIMGVGFSSKRLDAIEAIAQRTEFFKLNMPSLFALSAVSLAENCLYQYQCFSLSEEADKTGECREKIKSYLTPEIKKTVLNELRGKQKIWFGMFFSSPDKASFVRNKMKIGF